MLRSVLLGSSAVLAITAAQAADLPSRQAPAAFVAAAPALSWTGFYIGGQIGAISTRSHLGTDAEGYLNTDWTSVAAGAHFGYNHRFGNLVAGVEADANARFGNGNVYSAEFRSTWDASVRARFGMLVTPAALLYATAGAAFSNFDLKCSTSCGPYGPVNVLGGSRFGWTVGAGIEYALSSSWSTRIEYRHTDYGSKSTYDVNKSVRSRLNDDRITVGLSYHFGAAAAPVVAKY